MVYALLLHIPGRYNDYSLYIGGLLHKPAARPGICTAGCNDQLEVLCHHATDLFLYGWIQQACYVQSYCLASVKPKTSLECSVGLSNSCPGLKMVQILKLRLIMAVTECL